MSRGGAEPRGKSVKAVVGEGVTGSGEDMDGGLDIVIITVG